MSVKRKSYSTQFKAKLVLEVLEGYDTLALLGLDFLV